jgi:hypothetical protein
VIAKMGQMLQEAFRASMRITVTLASQEWSIQTYSLLP